MKKKSTQKPSKFYGYFSAIALVSLFGLAAFLFAIPWYQHAETSSAQSLVQSAAVGDITTYAGSGDGAGGLAVDANQFYPQQIAFDSSGNVYYVTSNRAHLRKVTLPAGTISNLSGFGDLMADFSGDGGLAVNANIRTPEGLAIDQTSGDIYFSDASHHRVRKIDGTTGIITTFAGTGTSGFLGDTGLATSARFNGPRQLWLDGTNDILYIADLGNNRIRAVNLGTNIITTFAGNGTAGSAGDAGLATAAELNNPYGLAMDASFNLYISEISGHRVRKVTAGIISTYAGIGTSGFSGDTGLATAAELNNPYGLFFDGSGNLFIADRNNHRIRKVNNLGVISTVAGDGGSSYTNGVLATATGFSLPQAIAVDGSNNLYISDTFNYTVRKVDAGTGIISAFAGNGHSGYCCDGQTALRPGFTVPQGVHLDADNNMYIADTSNRIVRKIDGVTGVVSRVAGAGLVVGVGYTPYGGDGGLATVAGLDSPTKVLTDTTGNVYFIESGKHSIRKVDAITGNISTIVGTGTSGYNGDGGLATAAQLNSPTGFAIDASGNIYIADQFNHRIRKITFATGLISTVAGNGSSGFSGDTGPATSANINRPFDVELDSAGNIYFSDLLNNRIRWVNIATGNIDTYVGPGVFALSMDFDQDDNLFYYQSYDIYKVAVGTLVISHVAGDSSGIPGFTGDAVQSALSAKFFANNTGDITTDAYGNVYLADENNYRIRKVQISTAACGDGVVQSIEQCDDTNTTGGDGCSASCQIESVCTGAICNIVDNGTGGECNTIGSYNTGSKICTLDQSLIDEVEIDSNGITLDCADYTLLGDGTDEAIRFVGGKSSVTIQNCVIDDWFRGISMEATSSNNIIRDNTLRNIDMLLDRPIDLVTGSNNTFSNNLFDTNRNAIIISFAISTGNVIEHNVVTNGLVGAFNLNLAESNIVRHNQIISSGSLSNAISVSGSNNSIENNYIRGSFSGQGIIVSDTAGTVVNVDILDNVIVLNSGQGINIGTSGSAFTSTGSSVVGNTITRIAGVGTGLLLTKFNGLTVQDNTFVSLGTNSIALSDADSTLIDGNNVSGGGGGSAGIDLLSASLTNTLTNNHVTGVSGSGIRFQSGANTNTANFNVALGNSSFDFSNSGTGNSGDDNTCVTTSGWNDTGAVGCTNGAPVAVCGNGFRDGSEVCDDGGTSLAGSCDATCSAITTCGDGTIQQPNGQGITEQCDDANTTAGDGCDSFCFLEVQGVASLNPLRFAKVGSNTNVTITFNDSVTLGNFTSASFKVFGERSGPADCVYTSPSSHAVQCNPATDFFVGERVFVTLTTATGLVTPVVYEFQINTGVVGTNFTSTQLIASGGTTPVFVKMADVNNDDDLDIISANAGSANLSILLGNGDGSFQSPALRSSAANPNRFVLGDVNNDTFLDIVVTNTTASPSVHLNNGNGTFASASTISGSTTAPINLALADLNRDGNLDLVLGDSTSPAGFDVLIGNGNGTFVAAVNYSNVAVTSTDDIGITDVDSDGDMDVVTVTSLATDLVVWLNNGSGVFGGPTTYNTDTSNEFAIGDLNNDRYIDIAADGATNLQSFINNGLGAYPTLLTTVLASTCTDYELSDIEGDGDLDALCKNASGLRQYLNNGSAVLTASSTLAVAGTADQFDSGDITGDGIIDLVIGGGSGNNNLQLYGLNFNSAPTAPTNLLISGLDATTSPTGISLTPTFSAICNDPDVGDIINKYRIQVSTDNTFGTVTGWESGAGGTSIANCIAGNQSTTINFGAIPLLSSTIYYWRIKFFDDDAAEGAFSITRSFTTLSSGGSSGGRLSPQAPTLLESYAVTPSAIRWNFQDTASNERGFELINDGNEVVERIEETDLTHIDEIGLSDNTLYEARKIRVFNDSGAILSATYPPIATLAPALTPKLIGLENSAIHLAINEQMSNLSIDQSAIMFELIPFATPSSQPAQTVASGWIQETNYTFLNIDASSEYHVRVRARNQQGVENEWSSLLLISQTQEVFPELRVQLSARLNDQQGLPARIDPKNLITLQWSVENIGQAPATNLHIFMPIPDGLILLPKSVAIDGIFQTLVSDQDHADLADNILSIRRLTIDSGATHIVSMQLAFDLPVLRTLKEAARATALPLMPLQLQWSYAESEETYTSEVIEVEADDALVFEEEEPLPAEPEESAPVESETPEPSTPPSSSIPSTPSEPTPSQGGAGGGSSVPSEPVEPEVIVQPMAAVLSVEISEYLFDEEDNLIIDGNTSEPEADVTIYLDGIVLTTVSDDQGNWQVIVSPQELNVNPGESRIYNLSAVAMKADLTSEVAQAADIRIFRSQSQEIFVDELPVYTGSLGQIMQTMNTVLLEGKDVVRNNEQPINAALIVTLPVVIVSSSILAGSLPLLPLYIYYLLTAIARLLTLRKKPQFAGQVYDSISKNPVPLAVLRIYSVAAGVRKLKETLVTNAQGRYYALLAPGQYEVEVIKPSYLYPSTVITSPNDLDRDYVSHGTIIVSDSVYRLPDIPVDPINIEKAKAAAAMIKRSFMNLRQALSPLIFPFLMLGVVLSVILMYSVRVNVFTITMLVGYLFLASMHYVFRPRLERPWGMVYELISYKPLPLAVVQLIDASAGRVVKSRLTDYEGRFSFLPTPGSYKVNINKPGYEPAADFAGGDKKPLPEIIDIKKSSQAVAGDVGMRKISNS